MSTLKRSALANGPTVRKTAATQLYEALRGEILSLALPPGSVLDERALAERFGVSRSPLREALIRLAGEQLVETLANRTSIVAHFDIADLTSYLAARELVYRLGARLAAEKGSPQDVAKVEAAMVAGEAAQDLPTYIEGNRLFHLAVAEAAALPLLSRWTRRVLDRGQRALALVATREASEGGPHAMGGNDGHRAMLAAIREKNPEAADAAAAQDAVGLGDGIVISLQRQALPGISLNPHHIAQGAA
jgi:DNA-binding GntR family transcriptional regulator